MIVAKSRIVHDGVVYEPGAELPVLLGAQLRSLIEAGAVEEVSAAAPEVDPVPVDSADVEVPNVRWNRARLVEYARDHGVDVDDSASKKQIIAAIEGDTDTTAPEGEGDDDAGDSEVAGSKNDTVEGDA